MRRGRERAHARASRPSAAPHSLVWRAPPSAWARTRARHARGRASAHALSTCSHHALSRGRAPPCPPRRRDHCIGGVRRGLRRARIGCASGYASRGRASRRTGCGGDLARAPRVGAISRCRRWGWHCTTKQQRIIRHETLRPVSGIRQRPRFRRRRGSPKSKKKCLHFSICACHPCAGAMLIFSVSFQF